MAYKLSRKELALLEPQYLIQQPMFTSVFLRDKVDGTDYQYFPDSLLNAHVDPRSPCGKSTLRVVLSLLAPYNFTSLCGFPERTHGTLRRTHQSCIRCRIRRVYRRELPRMFEIQFFTLAIDKVALKHKANRTLLKFFHTLCETCAIRW